MRRRPAIFATLTLILSLGMPAIAQDDLDFEALLNGDLDIDSEMLESLPEEIPAAEALTLEEAVEEIPAADESAVDMGLDALESMTGEAVEAEESLPADDLSIDEMLGLDEEPAPVEEVPAAPEPMADEEMAVPEFEEDPFMEPEAEAAPVEMAAPEFEEDPFMEPEAEAAPVEMAAPEFEEDPFAEPEAEATPTEMAAPDFEEDPFAELEPIPEAEPVEVMVDEQPVVLPDVEPEIVDLEIPEQETVAAEQPVEIPEEQVPSFDEPVFMLGDEGDAGVTLPAEKVRVVAGPAGEKAMAMSVQEQIRRQAQEVEGYKQLEIGYQALQDRKYDAASIAFTKAMNLIPERPATAADIERARWGVAEAEYRSAKVLYDNDDLSAALSKLGKALQADPTHRASARLQDRIEDVQSRPPKWRPLKKREEFIAKEDSIDDLIKEGRQYFFQADYDRAEPYFENVLLKDPYHKDAMRYLRKISELRFKVNTHERNATTAEMVQRVRDTWNPPIRNVDALPVDENRQGSQTSTRTAAQRLEERMSEIIIPKLEFREVNIQDVVSFLVEASIAGDPKGLGVNIILNLKIPGESSAGADTFSQPEPPADQGFFDEGDEFGGFFDEGGGAAADQAAQQTASFSGGSLGVPTVTLNLRRVSLIDAIKYITSVTGLKYRIDENVVVITPANVVSGRVISRIYPVQPSILDVIVQRQGLSSEDRQQEFVEIGGRGTQFQRQDVKEFFKNAGVPFPAGTSIVYNPAISSMIVANTEENLEVFERILQQINVTRPQVEIEARFVEVAQTDLEELGLEWIITDNVELAEANGLGPIATKERVQINADTEGFSKGNRFVGRGSGDTMGRLGRSVTSAPDFFGDILSLSSVLTNPEMTVVLHALDQKGNVDVLSAPRVTTQSGKNAIIEVVEEIIYPTEFETNVQTISGGEGVSDRQVVTVTPGSFETRETGVIMNVTPTVDPDGVTIELVLAPEVSELVRWLDYGYSFEDTAVSILQPIFASRNVTTSIVIWDGQTVVMGGLITEKMSNFDDKIPLLGHIPILGWLFRTKGEQSIKQNLLIFVTATVVDPSGNPKRRVDYSTSLGGGAAADISGTP